MLFFFFVPLEDRPALDLSYLQLCVENLAPLLLLCEGIDFLAVVCGARVIVGWDGIIHRRLFLWHWAVPLLTSTVRPTIRTFIYGTRQVIYLSLLLHLAR